jgi:hypothetical protein
MTRRNDTIAVILRLVMFGGCWWWAECSGLWGNDEFQNYVQRSDRMTTSSGDAKEVNAIAHIPTPWPRGVNDRRILADSAHMQRVLEWYRRSARRPDPLPDVPDYDHAMGERLSPEQQQGGSGGGAGGGAAAGSAQ